ncbi:MAG: zinc ribbon domain-containing protein [Bacillota bacterium]|nr:zinc ribbon domain-containing protein [Bacillota bacterium]
MKFCTKCGAPYEEGTKFCRQCGNPLLPPAYAEPDAQKTANKQAVFYEPAVEQIVAKNSAKPKKEKKKCKHKGLFIFLGVFVLLIGIAAALFFFTDTVALITGQSNHRILTTQEDCYNNDNEYVTAYGYEYDGSDMVREEWEGGFATYTYDGKHNLVLYTEEYSNGDETEVYRYSVNTYVEDGLTYSQFFDEDGYYCWTTVYDDHGWVVKRLDDNERVTFEREIEYNFFGRITFMHRVSYYYDDENSAAPDDTTWTDFSVEYDGDTMIIRAIDSSDMDSIGNYNICTYERTNFW